MVSLYNIVKIVINWIVSELRHRSTLQCLNFKTVPVLMHVKHCLTEMQNAVHSQTIIHLTLVHSLTLREVTAYACSQGPSILFLLSGKLPGDAIEVFHIMPAVDAPRHCRILAGIPHVGRHRCHRSGCQMYAIGLLCICRPMCTAAGLLFEGRLPLAACEHCWHNVQHAAPFLYNAQKLKSEQLRNYSNVLFRFQVHQHWQQLNSDFKTCT